jgi:ABC-type sugar transport system permease subunit
MTAGGPGTATTTVPVLAYNDTFQTFQFGAGAALAVMTMAVVVVMAAFMFRLSRESWRANVVR